MSNYQKLLKNPIYTGLMLYNGEIHEGKHEPIITKKLFDSVQEVMSRKSKPHSKGLKPYIYRGFFRWENVDVSLPPNNKKVITICVVLNGKNPCSQKYVREELITSQIQEEIKKFLCLSIDKMDDCRKCKRSAIGSPIEYAFADSI